MSEQWPVYGYDSAHTGHGRDVTRPEWPVDERWRHDFDGRVAWQAPVVDDGGRAFVHVKRTQVYAANFRAVGADGQVVWALKTGFGHGPGAPSPTVADDRVVLPDTPDGWVVERSSGGRLYETMLHPSGVKHPYPTVVDGRIHVGLRAFDLDTGEEVWTVGGEGPEYRVVEPDGDAWVYSDGPEGRAAAVADGTVYVAGRIREGETRFVPGGDHDGAEDSTTESSLVKSPDPDGEFRDDYDEWGHLHALDAADGSVEWVAEFETPVGTTTPTVVADGSVYVVDAERRLRTFDAEDGRERWTTELDGELVAGSRPAVADGRVFVGDEDGLLALDAADGTERWYVGFDDRPAGPPAVADGVVHASAADGTVHALDATGDERWRFDVGDRLRTGPVVAHGRVYVAGRELVCLEGRA